MAKEALLDAVDPPPAHVHRMRGEEVPERAAEAYEETLRRVFGVRAGGEPPRFDLMLLGMGVNGHTASLFPGSSALEEKKRWVVATHVDADTPWRITLTRPVIDAAAHIVFLVSGRAKAEPMKAIFGYGPEGQVLPAGMIEPTSGTLEWLVDADAASLMRAMP
jgi:6-phosphogluconolactonase